MFENNYWEDTVFAHRAMDINDSKVTSVKEKEQKLTELFASIGHELEFID